MSDQTCPRCHATLNPWGNCPSMKCGYETVRLTPSEEAALRQIFAGRSTMPNGLRETVERILVGRLKRDGEVQR